ncbi:MAG TPA: thioredoxin domain-containing protein, partial [Nitrosopumilaceae archaeon]|nr:thioredoxin domain-containing protein [Nitrosopumilaceae archaeon]
MQQIKYLSIFLLLSLTLKGFTQSFQNNQDLTIGDTIPRAVLRKIYRHSISSGMLNSFYNNLLLIDFWATWCVPCVNELPKLDSFTKIYSGQVTVLPVTYEREGDVKKLLLSKPLLSKLHLPFVVEDSILETFFDHTIVPHEIWVNKKGVVVAITSQLEVTDENIKLFLHGSPLNLPVKKDEIDFDVRKPHIKHYWQDNSLLADTTVVAYSDLTKFRAGIPTASHLWVTNLEESRKSISSTFYIKGISITNFRIVTLFTTAFDLTFTRAAIGFLNPNRFILDVYDSLCYMEHTDLTDHSYTDRFQKENTFT